MPFLNEISKGSYSSGLQILCEHMPNSMQKVWEPLVYSQLFHILVLGRIP